MDQAVGIPFVVEGGISVIILILGQWMCKEHVIIVNMEGITHLVAGSKGAKLVWLESRE